MILMKLKKLSLALFASTALTTIVNAADMPPNTFADAQSPLVAPEVVDTASEIDRQVHNLVGLQFTPEQTKIVKGLLLQQKRSLSSPYVNTPQAKTRSLGISLNPGEEPPVIRLSAGMLSTIVFTDSSGNPWNIEKISLDRGRFSDGLGEQNEKEPDEIPETNILSIEPLDPAAFGNVTVTLKGVGAPVILMLATGQRDLDVRVDARIPGRSPTAKAMYSTGNQTSIIPDGVSLQFMDGLAPEGAVEMRTDSPNVRAWKFGGYIYVRSNFGVIQPAFLSSFRANNGMKIFRYEDSEDLKYITFSTTGGTPKTVYLEDAF